MATSRVSVRAALTCTNCSTSAIDRGFKHFDFTIGDESYKRDWCDTELRLYDYLAAATIARPAGGGD